jgi:tRNA G18 (ribose-2'-O)-methylase SpoU
MSIVAVESDDPRLLPFTGLRDHTLRMSRERPGGDVEAWFVVEGDRLIEAARAAGYDLVSILRDPDRPSASEAGLDESIPVLTVSAEQAAETVGMHIHRWPLACFRRRPGSTLAGLLTRRPTRLVVADRIVNPTNLGSITRAGAGLGFDGLVLDAESCDPLYRRASRVGMGAAFGWPWARVDDLIGYGLGTLKQAGFTLVALESDGPSVPLQAVTVHGPVAVIIGNEGAGISRDVLAACDVVASIPMHAGVRSLNVATASAIAFWTLGPHRGAM